MSISSHSDIWSSFGRAIGAEPRENQTIIGVSGIEHHVQSIHVDDNHKRVIIFAAEHNPRIAAMMRVDIQATMQDVNVIMARPIFFDIISIINSLIAKIGSSDIDLIGTLATIKDLNSLPQDQQDTIVKNLIAPAIDPISQALENIKIPPISHIFSIVQQAAHLNWPEIIAATNGQGSPIISLDNIRNIDNIAVDRAYGICPIPLYELKDEDWDLLSFGNDIPEVRNLLKRLDIYQYFYPASDQAALALIDRGVHERHAIIDHIEKLPMLGHPPGDSELIGGFTKLTEMLDQLSELGYIAEGEQAYEISETGHSARSVIKYRPRESLISRIIAAFKVNVTVNPSDFIK